MTTIDIPENLYKRLESHASGFGDSPAKAIERLLDEHENKPPDGGGAACADSSPREDIYRGDLLLSYFSDTDEEISEEAFKPLLIKRGKAYIKIFFNDGSVVVKEWNIRRFDSESSVKGNLLTGRLRGWREKGIYKAEVSINRR